MKKSNTKNATVKVIRSNAITVSIPANETIVVAKIGVKIEIREFENERIQNIKMPYFKNICF